MKKIVLFLVLLSTILISERVFCVEFKTLKNTPYSYLDDYDVKNKNTDSIALVVETELYNSILPSLQTWYTDLLTEGYRVILHVRNSSVSPSYIREILKKDYQKYQIEGVFLLGDLPWMWYEETVNASIPYALDYYFMDLTGKWIDKDQDGWMDGHIDEDHGPEIYAGRLKADNLGQDEVQLVKEYFQRNHRFRTGKNVFPSQVVNLQAGKQKAAQRLETIFGPDKVISKTDLSADEYIDYLGKYKAEIFHTISHSSVHSHGFGEAKGNVNVFQVAGIKKNYQFYMLHNCSVGDFTRPLNLASIYLLVNTEALNVFTVTKSAGAYWFDHYFMANYLNYPHTTGQALKVFDSHYAWDDLNHGDEGEFHLLGDPTLKLSRYYDYNTSSTVTGKTKWISFNSDYKYSPKEIQKYTSYYDLHYGNLTEGGSSSWGHFKNRPFGDYQDDVHATMKKDDFCIFTFFGSAIEFYTEYANDHGSLDIWIDHKYVKTVHLSGRGRIARELAFSQEWSENGKHSIMLVNREASGWGVVDYFRVKVD